MTLEGSAASSEPGSEAPEADTTEGLRELEEAAVATEWHSRPVTSLPNSFTDVVDDQGKPIKKARALAQRFKYTTSASSTDRLRRIQQEQRYISSSSLTSLGASATFTDVSGPTITVSNPIASLVSCDDKIFLCLGELIGIKLNSKPVDEVPVSILSEPIVQVSYQLFSLRPTSTAEDPSQKHDWRSSHLLPVSCTVPGRYVQPVDPALASHLKTQPFFLFDSSALIAMTASLQERLLLGGAQSLPTVKVRPDFPYREAAGKACFMLAGRQAMRDLVDHSCPNCIPEVKFDSSKGQRILAHVGSHILHDPSVDRDLEPCGLCLRPAPICQVFLTKDKGSKGNLRVDMTKSSCPNRVKFSYGTAAKSTSSSPCSNVPIHCPLCPTGAAAVWRYNGRAHFTRHHPSVALDTYKDLWTVSRFEAREMAMVWKNRHRQPESRKKPAETLSISDAHSSNLASRSVALLIYPLHVGSNHVV
ncbi:hypothetical protein DENSPDRAFT_789907 [Dentipellis sp. KUC8613]|nr:hypothetical protein DENSPDRAFT_789907 [Dentipellis sp. KUC8613]